MHVYVYVWEPMFSLTTEPLDGCIRNFVGVKCSWPRKCFKVFRPIYPGVDPWQGKNMSRGRGGSPSTKNFYFRPQGYNDLEACGEKCVIFGSVWKSNFDVILKEGGTLMHVHVTHSQPLLQNHLMDVYETW